MIYRIVDMGVERDATPEEIADIEARKAAAQAPIVPQAVDALQGLLAIDFFGLAEAYDAWANSSERTFAERAFIAKAKVWKRNDPILIAAATALGVADQLDAMFIKAATL